MNEEQSESVRYSRILNDSDNDSFENSSTQFLVTPKNAAKTFKQKKMLLGVGIFVIIISIVTIVAVTSSTISSSNTIMTQNSSAQETSNSSTTKVPILNDSKMISHITIKTKDSSTSSETTTFPTETDNSKIEDEDDNLIYIGGLKRYRNFLSSVDLKSINNNKTCHIQSLDGGLCGHASEVTPIGVITCGGWASNGKSRKDCFRLTDINTWESFPNMNKDRAAMDMILVGDILVVFASFNDDTFEKINIRNGKKWELVKMNRTFSWPCVTKWNEESIFITGAHRGDETWILNIETNTMKQGPSLNKARHFYGCARLRDGSIIVVGGSRNGYLKSTEILEVGDHEWKNGPDLKEEIISNKVVKSNRKDYIAYSIAGKTNDVDTSSIIYEFKDFKGSSKIYEHKGSSKIYGLNVVRNEWELVDNLNEPRYDGLAVNVPSNLIPWCKH